MQRASTFFRSNVTRNIPVIAIDYTIDSAAQIHTNLDPDYVDIPALVRPFVGKRPMFCVDACWGRSDRWA
jgi:hypothetical protein